MTISRDELDLNSFDRINVLQKNVLDGVIEPMLEQLEASLSLKKTLRALAVIFTPSIKSQEEYYYNTYGVGNVIKQLRQMVAHPCPENRQNESGSSWIKLDKRRIKITFEDQSIELVNGRRISKDEIGRVRSPDATFIYVNEPAGLLSLTSAEDDNTPYITREAVLAYLALKVNLTIIKINSALRAQQEQDVVKERALLSAIERRDVAFIRANVTCYKDIHKKRDGKGNSFAKLIAALDDKQLAADLYVELIGEEYNRYTYLAECIRSHDVQGVKFFQLRLSDFYIDYTKETKNDGLWSYVDDQAVWDCFYATARESFARGEILLSELLYIGIHCNQPLEELRTQRGSRAVQPSSLNMTKCYIEFFGKPKKLAKCLDIFAIDTTQIFNAHKERCVAGLGRLITPILSDGFTAALKSLPTLEEHHYKHLAELTFQHCFPSSVHQAIVALLEHGMPIEIRLSYNRNTYNLVHMLGVYPDGHSNHSLVPILIARGANVNALSSTGLTSLDIASSHSSLKSALIEAGGMTADQLAQRRSP